MLGRLLVQLTPVSITPAPSASWPFSTFTSPRPANSVTFQPLSVLPSNRLCHSPPWLHGGLASNAIATVVRIAWRRLRRREHVSVDLMEEIWWTASVALLFEPNYAGEKRYRDESHGKRGL